ncbi:lytic transglycosylase domain-containing protein [Labrys sp. LIt4]|nr:lytic transglycosylase domain-containing protein [Labrys sp. LIt4]
MAETRRLRNLEFALAGCLTIGFLTFPGLAQAQTQVQQAPSQAVAVAAPGPVLKAKAKLEKRARRTGTTPAAVAAAPEAVKAGETTLAAIPLPPTRPRDIAGASLAVPPAPEAEIQTASIPTAAPAAVQKAAAEPLNLKPIGDVDSLITKHAARYNVPESLLRRVVKRESGFNPGARNGPYLGLMQMRLDTARGMGYQGGAAGLFDADTNLTYGAAYLANAWRVSGGSPERAVRLYSSGYYYEAKRKGMLPHLIKGKPSR